MINRTIIADNKNFQSVKKKRVKFVLIARKSSAAKSSQFTFTQKSKIKFPNKAITMMIFAHHALPVIAEQ